MSTGNERMSTGKGQMSSGKGQMSSGNEQMSSGNEQMSTGNGQVSTGKEQMSTRKEKRFPEGGGASRKVQDARCWRPEAGGWLERSGNPAFAGRLGSKK